MRRNSSSFRHSLQKDLKNSLGDAGGPAVSECFCSIQYTVYSYSIQYTVHHISVSVSFTFLIKTFCTPSFGGNSVPFSLPHQLETWWIFSRYVPPKLRLWSQTFDGVVPKPVGFVLGIFSWRETTACLFFLSSRENASLSPQKNVGIDIWYNGNRSHLKLQGIVLSWLCLYVFYQVDLKSLSPPMVFSCEGREFANKCVNKVTDSDC